MKDCPILFNGAMVRAILAGAKTQTRRTLKHEAPDEADGCFSVEIDGVDTFCWVTGEDQDIHPSAKQFACPYGQPGDRLWVREAFARIDGHSSPWIETDYRATYTHGDRLGDTLGIKKRWTPSIHMPRHASRITLEITSVRVERLQEISEADALAEGSRDWASEQDTPVRDLDEARLQFRALWSGINGGESWDANPWVWVVEFKRVEQPR